MSKPEIEGAAFIVYDSRGWYLGEDGKTYDGFADGMKPNFQLYPYFSDAEYAALRLNMAATSHSDYRAVKIDPVLVRWITQF